MRELHTFSDEHVARRFVRVLQSLEMPAHADEELGSWVIWIQNDDDRDKARGVLDKFQKNPDAPEYEAAEKKARQLDAAAQQAAKARQRLNVDIRDRWKGVWWKRAPVTSIMIAICFFVVVVCTNWQEARVRHGLIPQTCNDPDSVLLNGLFIVSRGSLLTTLMKGQIWRLVTPVFLHFDGLHILFNMMWLRNLGSSIEFSRGTRRFLFLVLLIAIFSNLTQYLWAGPAFGGMSGVVFGLIGYLWMKGKTQPHLGLGLLPDQVVWSVLWMLLCLTGAFGAIANGAHVGGLIVGILIGARQAFWKKLSNLKPPGKES